MISIVDKLENIAKQEGEGSFKIIAKELLQNFFKNKFISQQELADKCYCSISTVTHFSKSLLMTGYRELLVRMKIEREKYDIKEQTNLSKIETIQGNLQITGLKNILKWCKNNYKFIQNLVKDIEKFKVINIYSSNQLLDSAKFLNYSLKIKGYNCNNIDINLEFPTIKKMLYENENKVHLFLISGLDNKSLIEYYLKKICVNKKPYIITTTSQFQKLEGINTDNTILLNFEGDDTWYTKRHLAVTNLFAIAIENLKQNNN